MQHAQKLQVATSQAIVQSAFSAASLTQEQMQIIKNQIAPGISDNDLMYCLEIAKQSQLNPIIKDIYFVPRKVNIAQYGQPEKWVEKHEPMVGRKGARAIARRKGMKVPPNTGTTIKKFPVLKNGIWEEERDLIGWAEMTIENTVVRKEAAYSVFKQTTKKGDITKFWKDMPTVMIEKVAEFQLLDAIYGLDGVMSIDAGFVTDVESETTIQKLPPAKTVNTTTISGGLLEKVAAATKIVSTNSIETTQVKPIDEVAPIEPVVENKTNYVDMADLGIALSELGLDMSTKVQGVKTYAIISGGNIDGLETTLTDMGFSKGKNYWGMDVSSLIAQEANTLF